MVERRQPLQWHANGLWAYGARIGLCVGRIWQDSTRGWGYETAGGTISGATTSEHEAMLGLELAVRRICR